MAFKQAKVGGDFPDTWRPTEIGDRIVGEVTDKRTVKTLNGERSLIQVDTDEGPLTVWESAGLKSLFEVVEIGHVVDIDYEGEKVSEKTGRTFKSFNALYDDGSD